MLNNSISTLFSGMSTNSVTGSIYGSLSELSSIRNGSYMKLARKYYSNSSTDSTTKSNADNKRTTATAKDSAAVLASVKSSAEQLKTAADTLTAQGSGSAFSKKNGKYDSDGIYSAVSDFVNSYNKMIDSAGKSGTDSITNTADSMIRSTASNSKLLAKVGVTIGSDNKLSVNENTFKKADMSIVKSLFNGTGSYAYQTSVNASMMEYTAKNEASKSNTYTAAGIYSYNYNSGSLYSRMA